MLLPEDSSAEKWPFGVRSGRTALQAAPALRSPFQGGQETAAHRLSSWTCGPTLESLRSPSLDPSSLSTSQAPFSRFRHGDSQRSTVSANGEVKTRISSTLVAMLPTEQTGRHGGPFRPGFCLEGSQPKQAALSAVRNDSVEIRLHVYYTQCVYETFYSNLHTGFYDFFRLGKI